MIACDALSIGVDTSWALRDPIIFFSKKVKKAKCYDVYDQEFYTVV